MLCYCLECKKKIESKNPKIEITKNRRKMLSSNVGFMVSKNHDLLKTNKLVDY